MAQSGIFGLIFLIALSASSFLHGQILFGRKSELFCSIKHVGWSYTRSGQEIGFRQTLVPVTLFMPLFDNAEMRIVTAGAVSNSGLIPGKNLSGLADTKIQTRFAFLNDRLMVSAGLNVPTGKTKMSLDEFRLTGIFTEEIFGFHCRRFGEGLDVNVGAVFAFPAGPLTLGAGYALLAKGSYVPNDIFGKYQPGNETTTTGIMDIQWDRNLIRSSVIYKTFFKDQLNGGDYFQKGRQLIWIENILFFLGKNRLETTIVNLFRQKNFIFGNAGLMEEPFESSGSDFRILFNVSRKISQKTSVSGLLEWKQFGANQYPESNLWYQGKADASGLGVSFTLQVGKKAIWENQFLMRGGHTEVDGIRLNLTGIEIVSGFKTSL